MSIFGNKVAELGAQALTLSLTTYDELEKRPKEKIDKEWYVHCRNRVLNELKKQTLDDFKMQKHIVTIETFFEELGGEKEKETAALSWSQVIQKTIESQIVNSVVKSLKHRNEADEAIRDAIISKTEKTAPKTVIKRMNTLFSKLKGEEKPD